MDLEGSDEERQEESVMKPQSKAEIFKQMEFLKA